jgi:hypothetical protein
VRVTQAAPTQPAPERFASILFWLMHAVGAMSGGDRLSNFIIGCINIRLLRIKSRIAEIVAGIRAGTFAPRRPSSAEPPSRPGRPPPQNPLPNRFGWLLPMVANNAAAAANSQLHMLLQDPEMQALMAAAPAAMRRPLRSLCWMLAVEPPPILANPRRPRRPAPKPPDEAAARATEADRPEIPAPQWLATMRPSATWPKGVGRKPPRVRKNPA